MLPELHNNSFALVYYIALLLFIFLSSICFWLSLCFVVTLLLCASALFLWADGVYGAKLLVLISLGCISNTLTSVISSVINLLI